jgi:hypothetical protein
MPQEAKIINEISNSTQDWWPPKRVVAETRDNICGKKMMEAGAAEHQCGERQHAGPWISEAETDDEMWGNFNVPVVNLVTRLCSCLTTWKSPLAPSQTRPCSTSIIP